MLTMFIINKKSESVVQLRLYTVHVCSWLKEPEPEFLNVYRALESNPMTDYVARRAGTITLFLLGSSPPYFV